MTPRLAAAELTAAGIEDVQLRQGYLRARALNAEHGKTYYLATLLLPRAKRPFVHALYGFARYADDIVDNLDPGISSAERAREFDCWRQRFVLDATEGRSSDPIVAAVLDTIRTWQLPIGYFDDFLESMAMDLTVAEYPTYADLSRYMWGSAAVIGLQMLPVLGYRGDEADGARRAAIDLGLAFQLTNFIRDVGEDLDRGRVYLPQESLRACGVDRDRLVQARRNGLVDAPVRRLLMLEIERARGLYREAGPGLDLLEPSSQDCIRTALTLYGEILDRIEQADYQIFRRRISVPRRRRLQAAAAGLIRARRARGRDRAG